MRTPLLASVFLFGCNSFTNVEDACLSEGSPNIGVISDPDDVASFERINCYRRLAKRPKASADEIVQIATEGHATWMVENHPTLNFRFQGAGTPGFTGQTATLRLEEAGYSWPANSSLLELMLITSGDPGLTGDELTDFWFADPFVRGAWLQPLAQATGVSHGVYDAVDITGTEFVVGFQYWNIIYDVPTAPYAETPVTYPRNGQIDVPPQYVHLSTNPTLIGGQIYGYPITVTVGSREVGLKVLQASISEVDGPGGTLPLSVFGGDESAMASGLSNTLVIVPDAPFNSGKTYQVDVNLESDLGTRRVRTTFTVSTDDRPFPAALLRSMPDGRPAFQYSAELVLPGDRR